MYNYNTLALAFLQYKNALGYKYKTEKIVLKEIVNYLENNNIQVITKEVTEEYARINLNLTSNTIARNMGVFREFCKYLKLQDIECYQIPNKLYPQNHNNFTPYIFNHKEIKLIIKNSYLIFDYHTNYYHKTIIPIIIRILYQTGMRIGEVLSLRKIDYNYEEGYFHLHNTKNNEERLIVLPDDLNNIMINYYHKFYDNKNDDDKLFNISSSCINVLFYKILQKSNIKRTDKGPRLHDLRHTFVVHSIEKFVNEGKDLNVILPILQTYLGHKSTKALSYYFHMTKDILQDLNKLSEEKLGYLIPSLGEDYE